MPYSVKLKDQTGTEIIYNSVERVALPQASGSNNAEFMAKYSVTKSPNDGITYHGGDSAAHGVDYLCYIESTSTLSSTATVVIDSVQATAGTDYLYKVSADSKSAFIQIYGANITGKITITASKS